MKGAQRVCVWGGGGHIIEEGLYGSAGGSERRAPVLQRMTLVVSALVCVCVCVTPVGLSGALCKVSFSRTSDAQSGRAYQGHAGVSDCD